MSVYLHVCMYMHVDMCVCGYVHECVYLHVCVCEPYTALKGSMWQDLSGTPCTALGWVCAGEGTPSS